VRGRKLKPHTNIPSPFRERARVRGRKLKPTTNIPSPFRERARERANSALPPRPTAAVSPCVPQATD